MGKLIGALVLGWSLGACSDDQGFGLRVTTQPGSGGWASSRRPAPGHAVTTAGGAPGALADGAAGSSASAAGGVSGGGGSSDGGSSTAGAAGSGGELIAPSEVRLELCQRLVAPQQKSQDVMLAYRRHVYQDCRARRMILENGGDVYVFLNELNTWTFALWGCLPVAATGFGPLREGFTVTAADVRLLAELYLTATNQVIDLTPLETTELGDALTQLASEVSVLPGDHHELTTCDDGSAGAGGLAGVGGAAGGASGGAGAGGAVP